MASPRVVVVGAGIVGASIAWHLARRGAAVTLLDRGPPGGGVTARAFGWINGVHDGGEAGAALRRIAMAEYERLDAELGGALRIDRAGSLRWDADPGPLGPVRNLYVAVMHAGVTLAAAVGRLAAEEILGGAEAAPLARCRPARFGGSPD